ncbi:MAG: molybdenum cofactor guanylyltransferase [Nitrospira sp.]|nr:molybdenum cofactor guanylyltransferase [Nitrospira sp.]MDH4302975.1 molybdenum cofactor guanylyltransferase [Nitrospira sp.]MDH5193226.1 molybdenum cofactor guanylyltransferase [Nitrospira sp.]
MIRDVSGVLLAGGKSRRMGTDKRFLAIGGGTMLERSCNVLSNMFDRVCIVIAQDSPALEARIPVIRDLVPFCGSLGGLYTGLQQAMTKHIFLAACDMPFIHAGLVEYMVGKKDESDVVLAYWNGRPQPTHAVYSRNCLPVVEALMHSGNLKIQRLVTNPTLRVRLVTEEEIRTIDVEGRSFLNVNTPSDLDRARAIFGDQLEDRYGDFPKLA